MRGIKHSPDTPDGDVYKSSDRRAIAAGFVSAIVFVALLATSANIPLGIDANSVIYRFALPYFAFMTLTSYMAMFTVGVGSDGPLWEDVSKILLYAASIPAVVASLFTVGVAFPVLSGI